MGFTPGGLPWPDPTALVHQGDDAIRALAEAVDPSLATWVPTFTGITLGTTAVDAVYSKVGRYCDLFLSMTFTGSSVITGDLQFTLPVAARTPTRMTLTAVGRPNPTGLIYDMAAIPVNAGTMSIRYPGTSGSLTAITSTLPAAWVTNGYVAVMGRYVTATGTARDEDG